MIRFVDIATDAKPKTASAPASDEKAALPVLAGAGTTTSTKPKSTETPRKPKKTS